MPHRSADVRTVTRNVFIPGKRFGLLALLNPSKALPGAFDIFDLTGTSGKLPRSVIEENAGKEITLHDIATVGVRSGDGVIQFAVNLYGRRAHPAYPRGVEVDIDTNMDGTADYFVFNTELSGFDLTGQTVIAVQKAGSPSSTIYFYADPALIIFEMARTTSCWRNQRGDRSHILAPGRPRRAGEGEGQGQGDARRRSCRPAMIISLKTARSPRGGPEKPRRRAGCAPAFSIPGLSPCNTSLRPLFCSSSHFLSGENNRR